jgi:lipopolysaccharide biosynthesis regulator YciM
VHVDKEEIVDLLRSRGEHDKAATVGCALPRRVDTEADAGLLSQYDLNVREVAAAMSTEDRDGPAPA